MSETTHFIPVPATSTMLSMEQVGRIRGYCDALRIVEPTKYNVEQLSIAIELELNSELRALRDLQKQTDERKANPMYCIHLDPSSVLNAFGPGKAPAATKEPEGRTDAPPAPKKGGGMPLAERIAALPLDIIKDIKQRIDYGTGYDTASDIIKSILEDMLFGGEHLTAGQLASLLGVSNTTISLARKGKVRPILKARLAESFGWEGGAK